LDNPTAGALRPDRLPIARGSGLILMVDGQEGAKIFFTSKKILLHVNTSCSHNRLAEWIQQE
jgi:hypothetical protein